MRDVDWVTAGGSYIILIAGGSDLGPGATAGWTPRHPVDGRNPKQPPGMYTKPPSIYMG